MKVTIFTSNQRRHNALIKEIAKIADEVYVIQECRSVLPGYLRNASPTMKEYFSHVISSEEHIFGHLDFLPSNCHVMGLGHGDVSSIPLENLKKALLSEYYIVFGASYIKGELVDFLIQQKALNIHMGVSPYYRGAACNFWAIYDGHPEMVGATVHMLGRGLDSGDMLWHAFPEGNTEDVFDLGMLAVKSAFCSIAEKIGNGEILRLEPVPQDRSKELRYSRESDFTDEVARRYLDNLPTMCDIRHMMAVRDASNFLRPYILL